MNISVIADRYQPVVLSLVGLLMLMGIVNYFSLPAQEDPEITVREAVVTTSFPGLSSDNVELLITKKLEEYIREIPEIDEIRSTSRNGISIIYAKAHDKYTDLDLIWDDLKEQVEAAQSVLPSGTSRSIVNDQYGDVAVMTVALTGEGYRAGEKFDFAQHVRDQLFNVKGTKKVDLHGVLPEQIVVEFSNETIGEFGITQQQIANTLKSQNVIKPGGEIDLGKTRFLINPSGQIKTIAELESLLISSPSQNQIISLGDIATISREVVDPPLTSAYFNGEPAIIFAIAMLDGVRSLDYSPLLKAELGKIEQSLPYGVELDIVTDQAEQVENAVFGVTYSVIQTLVIVLAVVILFLGVRTGLIVGAIVPGVMLITLAAMGIWDIPLQRMSLATLVIALGLLVDNGIVIAEDFKRRLESGVSRNEALSATGKELALPLLASTLTTILVFLPLMLAEHTSGEYTRSISQIVLVSLLTSWVLAMTVTPILCKRFMKLPEKQTGKKHHQPTYFAKIEAGYGVLLRNLLCHKKLFISAMILMFVLGVMGIMNAPKKFFPNSDRSQVLITLELASSATLNQTNTVLKQVFNYLVDEERFPAIEDYAAYAGYGGPRFVLSLSPLAVASNRGFIVANVDEPENMETTIKELRLLFSRQFPDINVRVADMFLGPTDPNIIHLQVKGPDAQVVYEKGKKLAEMLKEVPGLIDVWQDWESPVPKASIVLDQAKARRAGVSSDQVASSLSRFYSGNAVSAYYEGDDALPIVMRGDQNQRRDLTQLYGLNIENASGEYIPILQVADVQIDSEFGAIQREDLTRVSTVEGRPLDKSPEDLVPLIKPILDKLDLMLPPGHTVEIDGIIADSATGKKALAANMPLCMGLVIILLVAQFNGFKRPLMILATIPLVVIGAAIGLQLMGAEFGFMVILGLLSLAGIVINNAIVLIDRIDIERTRFKDLHNAIIQASKQRLRPIIMTMVTTILGLLPLIVSVDPLFYGMASVIAFGLAIGTVLTLGVTPVLYAMLTKNSDAPSNIQIPAILPGN